MLAAGRLDHVKAGADENEPQQLPHTVITRARMRLPFSVAERSPRAETNTQAKIALVGHPGPDGADSAHVLELAAVNSGFESKLRSPLDDAILADAAAAQRDGWRYIADVPFDFDRRRASVLAEPTARRSKIALPFSPSSLAR